MALAVAGAAWGLDRARHVHSDDARVSADMVLVSSEIAGRVSHIGVGAGDRVTAGAPLLSFDDEVARLEVARLDADLGALQAEVRRETARVDLAREAGDSRIGARRSGVNASTAEINAARAMLATAEAEHARISGLRAAGLVIQPALERAADGVERARRTLLLAESSYHQRTEEVREAVAESDEAELTAAGIEMLRFEIEAVRHARELTAVALRRHVVSSPITGVVDEVFVDTGEYVPAGARLALIHDPAAVRVDANIKETDIARIGAGARVEIRFDAMPGRVFTGRVVTIRDASSAQFALIPVANPAGVFTKITQRVPVRIALDPISDAALRAHVRPGAMARLKIQADAVRH